MYGIDKYYPSMTGINGSQNGSSEGCLTDAHRAARRCTHPCMLPSWSLFPVQTLELSLPLPALGGALLSVAFSTKGEPIFLPKIVVTQRVPKPTNPCVAERMLVLLLK